MFANANALLVVASFALVALAQSSASDTASAPASTPSLSACLLGCVTQAASTGGCSSFTDLQCVCTSTAFQEAALSCLQQSCTASDIAAAQQLQQTECAAIGSGTTSAPTSTGESSVSSAASTSVTTAKSVSSAAVSSVSVPSTSSGSTTKATTATTSAASTTTSSSAAMALSAPFSLGSLVGTLIASAGALVGAAFIL